MYAYENRLPAKIYIYRIYFQFVYKANTVLEYQCSINKLYFHRHICSYWKKHLTDKNLFLEILFV